MESHDSFANVVSNEDISLYSYTITKDGSFVILCLPVFCHQHHLVTIYMWIPTIEFYDQLKYAALLSGTAVVHGQQRAYFFYNKNTG